MVTLDLYRTSSAVNRINKTINSVKTGIECVIKDTCSIINPRIILKYDPVILNSNYFQLFSRYYFIDNIELLSGGRVIIYGKLDPLYTYRNQIGVLAVNIDRSSSGNEPYVQDNNYTFGASQDIQVVNAAGPLLTTPDFDDGYYVLGVIGSNTHNNN